MDSYLDHANFLVGLEFVGDVREEGIVAGSPEVAVEQGLAAVGSLRIEAGGGLW